MTVYLIRRLLMTLPILLGVSVLSFGIMYLSPGKPAVLNMDPSVSVEARARQLEALGLNDPVHVQYTRWLVRTLKGDFGVSYIRQRPVGQMIWERLGNTMILMGTSLLLAAAVAIPLGILSAQKPYTPLDYAVTTGSFLGIATPDFWLALMLIMLFSVQLGWTPVGGMSTLGADFSLLDRLHHLILPSIVLATAAMASLMRYTRASMLEVLQQDYIRTARAKGFRERTVVYKHGLRNGLIPVITIFGLLLPGLVGGSVVVEKIFSWPGLGMMFIDATFQRDYPVIMALVMIGAVVTIIGNLIADVLYAVVDPRIEY
jgi:peptide/nickel transport system permease protein